MANTLLTTLQITRESVRLFKNSNAFLQNINRQFDDSFGRDGAKIGANLRIRLPNDYVTTLGPAASPQDTVEPSVTLTVATQRHVDVSFSSVDRTLSIDDFGQRYLAPMMNNLAGAVATDIMSGVEGGVSNITFNGGAGNPIAQVRKTEILRANAILHDNSAPLANRKLLVDPYTEAAAVDTLAVLFNDGPTISRQYDTAKMKHALGFDWVMDQTVIKHTAGSFTAGTVNGAGQSGQTLVVNAITGTLNKGDIITIAGVNAVNRVTKADTGMLRQFVVTANVPSGATSIPIYPAIIPSNAGSAVQFQTVLTGPANNAAISLTTQPNVTYRKNVAFAPEMVTMATADLYLPKKVEEAERARMDNISMRWVTAYQVATDQTISRCDILYGYVFVRPEWGVAVADVLSY